MMSSHIVYHISGADHLATRKRTGMTPKVTGEKKCNSYHLNLGFNITMLTLSEILIIFIFHFIRNTSGGLFAGKATTTTENGPSIRTPWNATSLNE